VPRFPRLRIAAVAAPLVPVLVALSLSACSGGGNDAHASKEPRTTTTTAQDIKLTVGPVHVESAGPDMTLDAAAQQDMVTLAQRYLDNAIVAPLRTGKLGGQYAALFDANVQKAATSTDRSALTEVDFGKSTAGVTATITPVRIDALADQSGKFLFLSAAFQVTAKAANDAGPANIVRSVELTYAPGPKGFAITAYRTTVKRATVVATTTTSAASTTTKADS
jgi:hypothetical protein